MSFYSICLLFRFFNQSTLRMLRGCITNHGKATGYRESRSVKGRQIVYPFIHPTENPLWHNAMHLKGIKPCIPISALQRTHYGMQPTQRYQNMHPFISPTRNPTWHSITQSEVVVLCYKEPTKADNPLMGIKSCTLSSTLQRTL